MTIFILASLFLSFLLIGYETRKHNRLYQSRKQSFWEKEQLANSTRRQPLDNLDYITIPYDRLPMEIMKGDERVSECLQLLTDLGTQKIVNFTGITNTDLKLKYGAPNINLLMEYDQNYTLLARTLHKWAELLYENGFLWETRIILEFAVSTKTDISKSYYLLAHIYRRGEEKEKLAELTEIASSLNTVLKNTIVRTLQESDPYSG